MFRRMYKGCSCIKSKNDYKKVRENMEQEINIETINYRLDKLEETLSQLKEVIINDRLQQRELELIKVQTSEIQAELNSQNERIKSLEIQPVRAQASRWNQIIEMSFKFVIGAILSFIAVKLGLNK